MSVSEGDVALLDDFPMSTMTRPAEPVRTDFERREPRCQARGRRVMATGEHDKRLRAELAAELGWYPADLDDDSMPAPCRRRPQEDRSRPSQKVGAPDRTCAPA